MITLIRLGGFVSGQQIVLHIFVNLFTTNRNGHEKKNQHIDELVSCVWFRKTYLIRLFIKYLICSFETVTGSQVNQQSAR